MKNILIHIPHSSYYIPQEYKDLFYLDDDKLYQEQIMMTDSYTDELFDIEKLNTLVFPISRLVCDVERFRNEEDEEMTKQGMWVCYTNTSDCKPLKKVDSQHKQEILKKYYNKHHSTFETQVEEIIQEHKQCLIIDAHSFSSTPLPYELHSQDFRPDICIGTNDYHTPKNIVKFFYESFKELGYKVEINNPFCGTIVPLKYYKNEKRVQSIMIEINRKLYLNEETGDKIDRFEKIKTDINKVIKSTPF